MREFILKSILFSLVFSAGYVAYYILADRTLNKFEEGLEIFVWGDSQTNQGVDMEMLNTSFHNSAISYAKHGGGVYDLMVFAEKVPEGSIAIIGYSIPVLMRSKDLDNGQSNLGWDLINMMQFNYDLQDLILILRKNQYAPRKIIKRHHGLYNTSVENKNIPASVSEGAFLKKPVYLEDKGNIYNYCFEKLKKKNCKIIVVHFPNNEDLQTIIDQSPAKSSLDSIKSAIIDSVFGGNSKTIALVSKTNLLHDFTHLNQKGAGILTESIVKEIENYSKPIFLTFKVTKKNQSHEN